MTSDSNRRAMRTGGLAFIVGALAFVGVFSFLAARFDYPGILHGAAADVLPRLLKGGETMRAVWALYAFLPLLLLPGAIGARNACPGAGGAMTLALIAAVLGAFAMFLGLARWPSIHWALAIGHAQADPVTQQALGAVFDGLNLFLGNYVGEFFGECCLAVFFALTGRSMLSEPAYPRSLARGLGWGGMVFGVLFLAGAFRNVAPAVQPIADLNNLLLPLWMIVLGSALIWLGRAGRARPA